MRREKHQGPVAIKQLNNAPEGDLLEIQILRKVHTANVVELLDVLPRRKTPARQCRPWCLALLTWTWSSTWRRRAWCRILWRGSGQRNSPDLSHVRDSLVVHRDLKPSNPR